MIFTTISHLIFLIALTTSNKDTENSVPYHVIDIQEQYTEDYFQYLEKIGILNLDPRFPPLYIVFLSLSRPLEYSISLVILP